MGTPDVAKKRILPPWMTKRVTEPAGPTNLKAKRRKKTAWARTETIYCMNEAELVDVALCILAEDCRGKEVEIIAPEDEGPEPQPVPTEPRQSTGRSSQTETTTAGSRLPNKLETSSCHEKITSDDDEDDDALKYVREIFFS